MMILSECRKVWSIRLIWDQEIAGSNPAVPTKAWKQPMLPAMIAHCGHGCGNPEN